MQYPPYPRLEAEGFRAFVYYRRNPKGWSQLSIFVALLARARPLWD